MSDAAGGVKGSFEFLYDYLDPMQKYSALKEVKRKDVIEEITNIILDNVNFKDFESIKEEINTKLGINFETDQDVKDFHGISNGGPLFDKDDYFSRTGTKDTTVFIKGLKDGKSLLKNKKLSVYCTRHPYISPALRSTRDIDFFLNYTPSIFASRMMPYLDVEFRIDRTPVAIAGGNIAATNITSPTIMRFLLGSVDTLTLKGADAALELGRINEGQGHGTNPDAYTSSTSQGTDDKNGKFTLDPTTAYSGMEMFLMPQTLTNMETLQATSTRLNDVKPFLPFASIEALDITLVGAGSGLLSHKTAVMRLKIHDKARLSEFAVFIKSTAGFAAARVFTTYGWRAPPVARGDDMYSDFINEKMMSRDRWMIINTSFSFDISGQVTLTLQLTNAGVAEIQSAEISENAYLQDVTLRLADVTKTLVELKNKLLAKTSEANVLQIAAGNQPADIKFIQVLQGAADKSFAGVARSAEVKGAAQRVLGIINSHYDKLGYSREEAAAAEKSINEFLKTAGQDIESGVLAGVRASAVDRFRTILRGIINDPFMVDPTANGDKAKINKLYFSDDYIELLGGNNPVNKENVMLRKDPRLGLADESLTALAARRAREAAARSKVPQNKNNFFGTPAEQAQTVQQNDENDRKREQEEVKAMIAVALSKDTPQPGALDALKISGESRNVASFGLIFTSFVAEAIFQKNTCDELQIFFYNLNPTCGPVSGQSIAEFPLDLDRLMHDYAEMLKRNIVVTIEAFLAMIMQTQFMDKRQFAFAMSPAFAPWSPDPRDKAEQSKQYEEFMVNYSMKYPNFTSPQIEMYIESGVDRSLEVSAKSGETPKITKRIHIYDVTANPRDILANIIQTSDAYVVGSTNNVYPADSLSKKIIREKMNTKMQAIRDRVAKTLGMPNRVNAAAKMTGVKLTAIDPSQALNSGSITMISDLHDASAVEKVGGAKAIVDFVHSMFPSLIIGTNGSLISTATVASKTNSLANASNMVQQLKGYTGGTGGALPPREGLEDPNSMPIRTYPSQLTVQSLGCPVLNLYQQFFIDFGTRTTIDNLYNVTAVKHTLAPGKFTTDMTFIATDAYGKIAGAPVIKATLKEVIKNLDDNRLLKQWESDLLATQVPPPTKSPQKPATVADATPVPVKPPQGNPNLTQSMVNLIIFWTASEAPANYHANSDEWKRQKDKFWRTSGREFSYWENWPQFAAVGLPKAGPHNAPPPAPPAAPTNTDAAFNNNGSI